VPKEIVFFNELHQAFLDASRRVGTIRRFFHIGGYTICLRFAGNSLEPRLTPAIEHLSIPACDESDLTVCLWDSQSTGSELPAPPWTHEDYGVHGEITGYNTPQLRTAFNLGSGVLSMLDTQRSQALFWIRDADALPIYESGAPLLTIFHWWMGTRARQLIHAAAIGHESGGILLVGKGGSGKSSTSLRALHADSDLLYAADDYCLLANDRRPFVHSLYSSGKIHTKDTAIFPFLQPALDKSYDLNNEKALFFLRDHFEEKISSGFPIKAVVLPRVMGQANTRVIQASAGSALLALAPSTIFQLSGAGQPAFQMLSELVRSVPCYILELGSQREQIPGVISDLLRKLT
jgi:hypothetical protein